MQICINYSFDSTFLFFFLCFCIYLDSIDGERTGNEVGEGAGSGKDHKLGLKLRSSKAQSHYMSERCPRGCQLRLTVLFNQNLKRKPIIFNEEGRIVFVTTFKRVCWFRNIEIFRRFLCSPKTCTFLSLLWFLHLLLCQSSSEYFQIWCNRRAAP